MVGKTVIVVLLIISVLAYGVPNVLEIDQKFEETYWDTV